MERLRPLTAEQLAALRTYAVKHGRRWKHHLREAWQGHPLDGELSNVRDHFARGEI